MQKSVLRILSGFLAVVFLTISIVPASAADDFGGGSYGGVISRSDFFTWTEGFGGGSYGGGAGRDQSKSAYDAYVSDLPASGYTSAGRLLWQPSVGDFDSTYSFNVYLRSSWVSTSFGNLPFSDDYGSASFLSDGCGVHITYANVSLASALGFIVHLPITGSYRSVGSAFYAFTGLRGSGDTVEGSSNYPKSSFVHYSSGDSRSFGHKIVGATNYPVSFGSLDWYFPVYEIIPDSAVGSSGSYNITTRPTSITGGNYGIVGDNGQIVKVEDNSTIVNETNNTYYNPATGTTSPIIDWSYDYSDRSYTVTTESGDTVTITYGDENITIQEGDTVYNVYYLVDGGSTEETPACDHVWTETSRTEPTCTRPGSVASACSKCQQTKTEAVPAPGHDWQVKQTVTTEYDDTGQLVQEGYTIFECSRCHEQYKSADGTIPPGGSTTEPGEDEETLWDKLGKLLGTAVKGILDLLGSAVDVVLGGLIDLVTNLFESLKQLVDLFGSVGEAFGVLWTWLPPEIMAILVAGVSIFVFVALLKLFMK